MYIEYLLCAKIVLVSEVTTMNKEGKFANLMEAGF